MAFVGQIGFGLPSRRKGMTLIELVIVAALISVLAIILIQGLSHARKQAWRLECAGNLRAFGNAYNFYAADLGRYPDTGDRNPKIFGRNWKPGDPKPARSAGLDNIGADLAEAIFYHSLGDARMFYCPTSIRTDLHAPRPFARAVVSGRVVPQWKTGKISYITLVGVTDSFLNPSGQPTFDPTRESPNRYISRIPMNRFNRRAVLAGDRTVELMPGRRNIANSNHGREGGWFYYTTGDAQWRGWNALTGHPTTNYMWYWPSMLSRRP